MFGMYGYPGGYKPQNTGPFWDDQCPDRGPGLHHVHWNKDERPMNICSDCGQIIQYRQSGPQPEPVDPVPSNRVLQGECIIDHRSLKAERTENDCLCLPGTKHLRRVEGNFVMEEHASHEYWKVCPECAESIELAMSTGEVSGPEWGPGRGPITARQEKRLEFLAFLERQRGS